MLIKSQQVKGRGRGKKIGFPTINLAITEDLHIDDGVYAAWIVIDDSTYRGALHYGSTPTFDESSKTLEVHLLDIDDNTVPKTFGKDIEVDIVEKIRNVMNFDTPLELANQISNDVMRVKDILS